MVNLEGVEWTAPPFFLQKINFSFYDTVNVGIFASYIFSRNSRFLNIHENMYTVKIPFMLAYRVIYSQNVNINPREIANFRRSVKIYTSENIYVHSNLHDNSVAIKTLYIKAFLKFDMGLGKTHLANFLMTDSKYRLIHISRLDRQANIKHVYTGC